jgi:hypothetical protein
VDIVDRVDFVDVVDIVDFVDFVGLVDVVDAVADGVVVDTGACVGGRGLLTGRVYVRLGQIHFLSSWPAPFPRRAEPGP